MVPEQHWQAVEAGAALASGEQVKPVNHPDWFMQLALDHNSKAVHLAMHSGN